MYVYMWVFLSLSLYIYGEGGDPIISEPFFWAPKNYAAQVEDPRLWGCAGAGKLTNDVATQNRIPMDPQWTHNGPTIYGSFVVFHQFDTSIFFGFPMNYIPSTNE